MVDNCTVKGCKNLKQSGNIYFCDVDRNRWINLCKEVGIHERIVDDDATIKLLKKFQNAEV